MEWVSRPTTIMGINCASIAQSWECGRRRGEAAGREAGGERERKSLSRLLLSASYYVTLHFRSLKGEQKLWRYYNSGVLLHLCQWVQQSFTRLRVQAVDWGKQLVRFFFSISLCISSNTRMSFITHLTHVTSWSTMYTRGLLWQCGRHRTRSTHVIVFFKVFSTNGKVS